MKQSMCLCQSVYLIVQGLLVGIDLRDHCVGIISDSPRACVSWSVCFLVKLKTGFQFSNRNPDFRVSINIPNCILLDILGPTARWCPMSPHFLTRWVSRVLGLTLLSWATARVGVLHLSYLGGFHLLLQIQIKLITHTNEMWIWGTDSQPPGEYPINFPIPWKPSRNSEFWAAFWKKVESLSYKEKVVVDSIPWGQIYGMHKSP